MSLAILLPLMLISPLQGDGTGANLITIAPDGAETPSPAGTELVQLALLLDTSGSMKGLIDQARCQLWNVVSELSRAERQGSPIALEIAVYQYGTNSLGESEGFLRQVVGFTDNLDKVSSALISLAVGGSHEYCGQVIGSALEDLAWSDHPDVYKAVFIAGNEPFDQGPTSFGEVLGPITERSITLNTIYCGAIDGKEKTAGQWRFAAALVGGLSARIDHNHHLPQMETPFDERIRELNAKLNDTFVWYGSGAEEAARNQREQDGNARKMSDHAYAARMSAKIGHLYHHVHHDLVDAIQHGKVDLATMPAEKMPPSVAKLSARERVEFVSGKTRERQAVRRQMADVIASRHCFLEEWMSGSVDDSSDETLVLGNALVRAIRERAQGMGYDFAD